MVDGIIENQTAGMLEPFCDGCGGTTDNTGLMYVDRDMLLPAVTELDALGFQVHMHAIGDRAVRNALDAVAAARDCERCRRTTGTTSRTCRSCSPPTCARFAELDVVANCQTYWAQREPQMEEHTIPWIGADRADLQYPFGVVRALRRAPRDGQRLAGDDAGSAAADGGRDPARRSGRSRQRAVPAVRAAAPWTRRSPDSRPAPRT